jgi:hypothetical protein
LRESTNGVKKLRPRDFDGLFFLHRL